MKPPPILSHHPIHLFFFSFFSEPVDLIRDSFFRLCTRRDHNNSDKNGRRNVADATRRDALLSSGDGLCSLAGSAGSFRQAWLMVGVEDRRGNDDGRAASGWENGSEENPIRAWGRK